MRADAAQAEEFRRSFISSFCSSFCPRLAEDDDADAAAVDVFRSSSRWEEVGAAAVEAVDGEVADSAVAAASVASAAVEDLAAAALADRGDPWRE